MPTDRHFEQDAAVVHHVIPFPIDDIGHDLIGALRGAFRPGYAFEVVDVRHFFRDVTAQVDYDVLVTDRSVLGNLFVADAVPDGGNTGNGTVGSIALGADSTEELITLEATLAGNVSEPGAASADIGNTGNGTVGSIVGKAGAPPETITLTATSATDFSVVGSVSGALAHATVGTPYVSAVINLAIAAGGTAFVAGDKFTIVVTNAILAFTVVGSVSGTLANAVVGTPYTSSAIDFTISSGGTGFVAGDSFVIAVRNGIAPVAATAGAAQMGIRANRRGTALEEINVAINTDADGAAEEGTVFVTIRPSTLKGE